MKAANLIAEPALLLVKEILRFIPVMGLMHTDSRLVSVLAEKNRGSIVVGRKIKNAPECRMSHQKIKNVFQ